MPEWVVKLEFCDKMNVKPWEFFVDDKLLWWHRWKALRDEAARIDKQKANQDG